MADDWYCRVGEAVLGPLPANELRSMASAGRLKAGDLVKKTEAGRWLPARSVKGLTFATGPETVTPPVAPAPAGTPQGKFGAGIKVPRTGTYKCLHCGPEGMGAVLLQRSMQSLGLPYNPPPSAKVLPPHTFFKEGETFPSCPNCKNDPGGADPTGWSFWSKGEYRASPMKTEAKNGAGTAGMEAESLWYVWSFIPGLIWAGWLHAGIRARRLSYYLFAVLYFAVLNGCVAAAEALDKNPDSSLAVVASVAIKLFAVSVYFGGIAHTLRARTEVDRRIKEITPARPPVVPAEAGKPAPSRAAGSRSPAARSLEDFARAACKAKSTVTIRMDEFTRLIPLLLDGVRGAHPNLPPDGASGAVMRGLVVHCPKCGQYSESAVAVMAMAGTEPMADALFGGPKVAALGSGRCPGCGGTVVQVTYDPK